MSCVAANGLGVLRDGGMHSRTHHTACVYAPQSEMSQPVDQRNPEAVTLILPLGGLAYQAVPGTQAFTSASAADNDNTLTVRGATEKWPEDRDGCERT